MIANVFVTEYNFGKNLVAMSENSTAPLMFALLVSQFVLNLFYDSTKKITPTSTHLSNLYLALVVIDSNDTGSANSTITN